MKQIKLIISILILPLTVMADGDHKTIELSEFTKNSMNRTPILTSASNDTMVFDTRNGFRSTTFVRLNKDGTKETLCTTSVAEAKKFMLGETVVPQSDGE